MESGETACEGVDVDKLERLVDTCKYTDIYVATPISF